MRCDICIDVDDVAAAVRFYGEGIGLEVVKQEPDWAQLKVEEQTIWIMKAAPGPSGAIERSYHRHWTPVHLDFHVDDIDKVIARAVAGRQARKQTQAGAGESFRSCRQRRRPRQSMSPDSGS
jgi:catechol 2,3-dioxygenase-like lactoylglutathione lyase family enzyme